MKKVEQRLEEMKAFFWWFKTNTAKVRVVVIRIIKAHNNWKITLGSDTTCHLFINGCFLYQTAGIDIDHVTLPWFLK